MLEFRLAPVALFTKCDIMNVFNLIIRKPHSIRAVITYIFNWYRKIMSASPAYTKYK